MEEISFGEALEFGEKITALFKALEAANLVTRKNFLCCGSCAASQLGHELRRDFPNARGAVFYTQQAARGYQRGGIWLDYGARPDSKAYSAETLQIGLEVERLAIQCRLGVEWDHSPQSKILIKHKDW